MKKILLGAAILVALASPALAADLPAKIHTKAPIVVAPVYKWIGFYVGGNFGYSWGRSSDTRVGSALLERSIALNGIVGGGQVGYNWQTQNWVWGFETDFQGTGERGTRNFFLLPSLLPVGNPGILIVVVPAPVSFSQQIDWFGTVRARGGFLVAPRVLVYGTGGLAYGDVKTRDVIGTSPWRSANSTNVGWTAGAGIEGLIDTNWTAKLEYLYVDLGTMSGSFMAANTFNSRITDNVLRAGVNYKFGGL